MTKQMNKSEEQSTDEVQEISSIKPFLVNNIGISAQIIRDVSYANCFNLSPSNVIFVITDDELVSGIHPNNEALETPRNDAFGDIISRLENLEMIYQHGVRPALSTLIQKSWFESPDQLPPASSAAYELFGKLTQLKNTAERMLNCYDDLVERLQQYVNLTSQLDDFMKNIKDIDNRYYYRAVLMINDAFLCKYSEEFTKEQVETIISSIVDLQNFTWDREKLRSLDSKLRTQGFETVISDKYQGKFTV